MSVICLGCERNDKRRQERSVTASLDILGAMLAADSRIKSCHHKKLYGSWIRPNLTSKFRRRRHKVSFAALMKRCFFQLAEHGLAYVIITTRFMP